MPKPLVIVESPAKARTIAGFLGNDFNVESSVGHIRDLPASGLNIDVEHHFEPTYEVHASKKDVIRRLKALLKEADGVISWNTIRFTGTFGFSTSSRCQLMASPSRSSSVAR